jgi:hypothetical protein
MQPSGEEKSGKLRMQLVIPIAMTKMTMKWSAEGVVTRTRL